MLELQHSSISEVERCAREDFYTRGRRMFWLVHIHGEDSFLNYNFAFSLDFRGAPLSLAGRPYSVMRWMGRSKQFIEKWKKSEAHVFFDAGGRIFHLASATLLLEIGCRLERGQFALSELSRDEFVRAVWWKE